MIFDLSSHIFHLTSGDLLVPIQIFFGNIVLRYFMRVDFLLVSYAPGGCSSPAGRLMQHPGTEYGYLIQGELTVTLGRQSHRLTTGDAVSFASVTPHFYRNEGMAPSVGVWFVAQADGPAGDREPLGTDIP